MEYTKFFYEKKGGIIIVTFNNPEKLNALTKEFLEEFSFFLDKIEQDEEVQVVILTGAGKAFVAGADISLMQCMTPEEAAMYSKNTTDVYAKMEGMRKIFIAAINGFALGGGCEFTLACDLRIASTRAKFGLPEASLGIFPGGGGTQRLPRLIGMAKAKELVYTTRIITADMAEKIGLVNEVVQADELLNRAQNLAAEILKNSNSAIRLSKEAFNQGAQMDIISAINLEKNLFALCFATDEQKEGMAAFTEKRTPNFK